MRFKHLLLFPLFLVACTAPNQPKPTPPPEAETFKKHPLDKSQYHRFVLDNGLKVLLVSDSRYNKSAAALLVDIGYYGDPPDRGGLAHYLEHMLFLGTEKYPGVDDYGTYLSQNGGYDNAYTIYDHTNYHLQVNHDAFEGALDRLAQFFIAPLFTPEYTERERNAVHSEYQSLLERDGTRTSQVQALSYKKDHPASQFNIGSHETLGKVSRTELLDFYRAHYSANRMSLVLLGKAPADTLEQWATTSFSPIENRNLTPYKVDPTYLPEKSTFRLIQVEPVKDVRTLDLEFPLDAYVQHYASKPAILLANLTNHEGKGSLLSLLKREDLATGLNAGEAMVTREFGIFYLGIDLTAKGLAQYKDVVQHCLTYIQMLKDAPYPDFYFREKQTKARLDEIYSDRGEGGGFATHLARMVNRYPFDIAERIPYFYQQADSAAYREILSQIRPNNMLVTLTAKGVPTTDTEHYFGAKYSYSEDHAFYQTLLNLPQKEEIHLPEPNPFMPTRATIPDRPIKDDVKPTQLINEPGLILYHSEDHEFLRPKISLQYRIRFPRTYMNLQFKVLLDTYIACVNESLNELAYPARSAGLGYNIANDYEGITLSIGGFSASAAQLFEQILAHMQSPKITDQTFKAIQDRIVRDLKNFPKQDAYLTARFLSYELLQAIEYRPEKQWPVAEQLTLEDILSFAQTLYKRAFIEGLAHGNIASEEATKLIRRLQVVLGTQPEDRDATFEQTYLQIAQPESLRVVEQLEVSNSSFWRQYYVAPNIPQNRACALILNAFIYQPFFTELRTNQQLGYIVSASVTPTRDYNNLYALFIIQSDTYPADEVERRADAFIQTLVKQFEEMPAETFGNFRTAAIEDLKKKSKTISEKADKFRAEAFDFQADFDRDPKAIEALEALTKNDVSTLLKKTLQPKTRRMWTAVAFAKDHKPKQPVPPSFDDLNDWKKTRIYR